MDLTVTKTSAANDERQERRQGKGRRPSLRERRKNGRDRRRSVNDGVLVSLSLRQERRLLPDRRRNRVEGNFKLPEPAAAETTISTLV